MPRILGPKLLLLSLALPSASLALGLGDIHIESALGRPLIAQIDLVGATPDELTRLSAAIANDEIFERYGLERPSYVASTAVKVSKDSQGRAVLVLHSIESFVEPVVTFLVDLQSPNGELIREYTILLDPVGLGSEHSVSESASAPPVPAPTPTSISPST